MEQEQIILKFVQNYKRPWIAKAILRKKEKAGGITLFGFKLHYKATVIKRVWYWYKNRHIDQWNRIGSPEINPCLYGQVIYDKGSKNIQWGIESLLKNGIRKTQQLQANEWNRLLSWTKDLNVRPETIKLLEENKCSMLFDICLSNTFLDLSFEARTTKAKINGT